jgi:hypothetical protein
VQVPEAFGPRPGGGRLRIQYLEIDDPVAAAVPLSRPDWLWGAEHGFNQHGVAIENEKVDTVSGLATAPPALIGMDCSNDTARGHRGPDIRAGRGRNRKPASPQSATVYVGNAWLFSSPFWAVRTGKARNHSS